MSEPARDRIRAVMARVFDVDQAELSDNPQLGDHPAWDSLAHIRLVMEVEAEMGVRFITERIPELTSLDAFVLETENS